MSNLKEASLYSILRLPITALKLTGFDILSDSSQLASNKLLVLMAKSAYFGFICANLILIFFLQTIFVILIEPEDNSMTFVHVVASIVNETVLLWKIYVIWLNKPKVLNLLNDLDELKFNSLNLKVKPEIFRILKAFNILKIAQFTMLCAATISFCLMPVAKYLLTGVWYNSLPWDFWLPFDKFDPKYYNFVYLWIDWMSFNMVLLFFSGDMIIYAIIILISIKFIILNHQIVDAINEDGDVFNVIESHKKLLDLVQRFNALFSSSFFVNFVGSSGVICIAAFLLASSNDFISWIQFGLLLQVLLGQIFLLCLLGDLLKNSSERLVNSIYCSNWYEVNDKAKKVAIKIMLVQAQRTCQISAWKMLEINYETFMRVLNATYSYFMLLKSKFG